MDSSVQKRSYQPSSEFLMFSAHNDSARMHRRVTVVGSVCLLSRISSLEHLFVLKILSRTQQATDVKNWSGFLLNSFVTEIQYCSVE